MTDIHSCSYYCDRPECVKAQRDELRAQLERLRAQDRTVQLVRPLPETMSRDEMLLHYSEHANLCAHEALQYQKRIRDLEKAAPPAQPAQRLTDEQITQALRRAYYLGQTYWQQADSEFTSEHRKADATSAKLNALIAETIATTRAQRRELERQNAKMPRGLRLVPRDEWPLRLQSAPVLRVWRSRDFLVQEYAEAAPVLVRLSVLRTTLDPAVGRWVDGITWEELQGIKSECGYGQHDALEIYPVEGDVVNVANLRHLWVMRAMVTFAWRATPAAGTTT